LILRAVHEYFSWLVFYIWRGVWLILRAAARYDRVVLRQQKGLRLTAFTSTQCPSQSIVPCLCFTICSCRHLHTLIAHPQHCVPAETHVSLFTSWKVQTDPILRHIIIVALTSALLHSRIVELKRSWFAPLGLGCSSCPRCPTDQSFRQ
jgi:hypothetical protein